MTVGMIMLAAYVGVLQLLRFQRVRGMKLMDVKGDPSAVYRQVAMLEFPFTVTKALEFALFRTYGVPSISKLLHKTGEFSKRVGKRYDDTDLLLREYSENCVETARSRDAIDRVNAIHGMYSKQISNADMLFTLSLFVTEPAVWIDRYEWRRCSEIEKEALLGHFSLMGERMGIKGVREWKTWDDADAFQREYEAKHFQTHASNNAIATSTIELFLSIAPEPLRSGGRWAVYALMDVPLLKAMDLPQAPLMLQWVVKGCLLLRALVLRFLVPPRPECLASRRTPYPSKGTGGLPLSSFYPAPASTGSAMKPRFDQFTDKNLGCLFYKDGYTIGDLGTAACPAGRLMSSLPEYTGSGGGGGSSYSGAVVVGGDDAGASIASTAGGGGGGSVTAEAKKDR
eukprot:jgi/Undpi1/7238/HiC_scaffold_22.g09711.m1